MTWDEIKNRYPMNRDEMTIEQERDFVNSCFDAYEQEGFAKVYWSVYEDYKEYFNKPFKVVHRLTTNECDLECLPMWEIEFEDGMVISAFPDEIIPSEMINTGCKLEIQ